MIVERTMDFKGNGRTYGFNLPQNGNQIVLDPGIAITLQDGQVKYTQIGGQIGPANRNSLDISFSLDSRSNTLDGMVSIDADKWDFAMAKDGTRSVVNDVEIGAKTIGAITPPLYNSTSASTITTAMASITAARSSAVSVTPSIGFFGCTPFYCGVPYNFTYCQWVNSGNWGNCHCLYNGSLSGAYSAFCW